MTTKVEGHYSKQTYIIHAVNAHEFVIDMSSPITAEIQRFDSSQSEAVADGGTAGTAVSYGATLMGATVTFSTEPVTGGTAILTIKGRL